MANFSNIDNVHAEPKPWFAARMRPGLVDISGDSSCSLGRRIPVPGSEEDEGVYIDWEWDGEKLVLKNDRFGLYPIFYCVKEDSICVSPSLSRVVRTNSERQLDYAALGVFFRLGHFIGEDTPFEDIRFMPPNSILIWEAGKLELKSKGSPMAPTSAGALSFDETVEQYRALFSRSIARRMPDDEPWTVPVSGGRDSRHILLELARQGARPRSCATVMYRPPATNEDIRIARLLAERLGIEHVALEKPSSFFQAELNDVKLTNYCGGGHGWVHPVASDFAGKFHTIYDGLAGSVLSGGFMLAEEKVRLFKKGSYNALGRTILEENKSEDAIRHIFSEEFYRKLSFDHAVERLAEELKRHGDVPNPVLSFVFWNRTRRCVASIPFAIFHQVPVVHTPYLDHELFNFLFSLDVSFVEQNRLHDEVVRRSYPDFADVPYENKNAKADFSKVDFSYYRAARSELFGYLRAQEAARVKKVNKRYLFMKLGSDFLGGKIDAPWYMRPALQVIELERLVSG